MEARVAPGNDCAWQESRWRHDMGPLSALLGLCGSHVDSPHKLVLCDGHGWISLTKTSNTNLSWCLCMVIHLGVVMRNASQWPRFRIFRLGSDNTRTSDSSSSPDRITCTWIPQQHWKHPLRWRHNGRDGVSDHQPHDCLLNRLFRHRSKKTSKLRVTGLCAGNSPGTGEFLAQRDSYAENVSIRWRHHVLTYWDRDKWSKYCDIFKIILLCEIVVFWLYFEFHGYLSNW